MKDLILKKPHAACYEVRNLDENNQNCLRVWHNSTWVHENGELNEDETTCMLQIRTFAPIAGDGRRGKPRNMIAHLSVSIAEIKEVLEYAQSRKH